MFFFSKWWGIKHRISEQVMADITHILIFIFCAIVVIHKYSKLKQKRCQNDLRFRRIGGSSIFICLIPKGGNFN